MIAIPVRASSGPYAVLVGGGLLRSLGERIAQAGLGGRIAVIADATVLALHGEAALASLPRDTQVIEVPPGEASKSLVQAERLWTALIEGGLKRSDTLLALGGGVVGDLAGFVAATYHRGMPFVQVPTTLLSQVDSSVGGKVAIDHPLGKNLIGAFHPPRLVVADTDTLATLPIRERWSGLAEVAKAALLADPELLAHLEVELESLAGLGPSLAGAIARAVRIKAAVVEADEHERDLRRILNFGHTVGHGLEAVTGFGPLTHGEAVVLGMRGAIRLSQRIAGLSDGEAERALALLRRFPVPAVDVDPDRVLAAARRDKKGTGFVVLPALGRAEVVPVGEDDLRHAIASALEEA